MENQREQMVREIKAKYGLNSPKVLSAMLQVPRHEFVEKDKRALVYADGAVSIGFGQTISQPYTVASMTHLLLQGSEPCRRVLEIGTGSGYQAAVLAKIFDEVYSVEIIPELADKARSTLKRLGYKNIYVRKGSGEVGWKGKAPFDAILVTAGIAGDVPQRLFDQLKIGGILIAPIGNKERQIMTRFTKQKNKETEELKKEEFGGYVFVPFVTGGKNISL